MPDQATSLINTDCGETSVGATKGVGVAVAIRMEFSWRGVPAMGLPFASLPTPPNPVNVPQFPPMSVPPRRSMLLRELASPPGHPPSSPLALSTTAPEGSNNSRGSPPFAREPV